VFLLLHGSPFRKKIVTKDIFGGDRAEIRLDGAEALALCTPMRRCENLGLAFFGGLGFLILDASFVWFFLSDLVLVFSGFFALVLLWFLCHKFFRSFFGPFSVCFSI
jgi:hypothetical protein